MEKQPPSNKQPTHEPTLVEADDEVTQEIVNASDMVARLSQHVAERHDNMTGCVAQTLAEFPGMNQSEAHHKCQVFYTQCDAMYFSSLVDGNEDEIRDQALAACKFEASQGLKPEFTRLFS